MLVALAVKAGHILVVQFRLQKGAETGPADKSRERRDRGKDQPAEG